MQKQKLESGEKFISNAIVYCIKQIILHANFK